VYIFICAVKNTSDRPLLDQVWSVPKPKKYSFSLALTQSLAVSIKKVFWVCQHSPFPSLSEGANKFQKFPNNLPTKPLNLSRAPYPEPGTHNLKLRFAPLNGDLLQYLLVAAKLARYFSNNNNSVITTTSSQQSESVWNWNCYPPPISWYTSSDSVDEMLASHSCQSSVTAS
jgi:hypothetical protein